MPTSSDAERDRPTREAGKGESAPPLPPLEDTDRWTLLAAAVSAQSSFDSVGFTAERPIDLRSDEQRQTE